MNVLPGYRPPDIPNHVWFSNYGISESGWTSETAKARAAKRLGLPIEAIHVEPFRSGFAAYVAFEFGAEVDKFHNETDVLMQLSRFLTDGL